jgi:hypothetical protein
MLESKVLVIKLFSIYRLSSGTIVGREVTTLAHELLDDSVEGGSFVV